MNFLVSDLRNHYSEIQKDVMEGGLVFVAKSGCGSLVVMRVD